MKSNASSQHKAAAKARPCSRMLMQKITGIAILLFALAFLWLCSTSQTAAERDSTIVAILIPIGLCLLFTKQQVIM